MAKRSETEDRLHAIRFLAARAPKLRVRNKAECGVLKQLIEVAGREADRAQEQFEATIRRSSQTLSPLGEPFAELDFVEHRWVAGHREEAFSDWLQWIIARADPGEVLSMFGVTEPELKSACNGTTVTVEREQRVLKGNEGSAGKLDLKIWFGDAVLLVVEVKLGEAEGADTAKGKGYIESLRKDPTLPRCQRYVILVLDADEEDYHGFKPRLWADACLELRLLATQLCKDGKLLKASMTLGFVAAVEQNILKLRPMRDGGRVTAALSLPLVTDHLTRFLEASN
jgi:hypothetical protein